MMRFSALFPLSLAMALFSGCGKKEDAGKARRPAAPPVVVEAARQVNVPFQVKGIGNVEPFNTVAVKAQVGGELTRVYFQEGQEVRKGDLLFQIDPRTFQQAVAQAQAAVAKDQAALQQAVANLARDQATARNAKSQSTRYSDLASKGVVSREQNEQFRTTAEAAEQAVQASQANIESARATIRADESRVADAQLQLSYATIRAPISGKTGTLTVKAGNLVQANAATPLIVINQLTPVYVSFSVPEQALHDIRQYDRSGKLAVEAILGQSTNVVERGTLTFIVNNVDPTTGTIRLKATFPNQSRALTPGQFITATMTLYNQPNALVVPAAAVQTGQKGRFVFVVKPDQTAEQRSITAARPFGDQIVVSQGLRLGERVVVDGQVRVVPGAKVEIVKGNARPASGSQGAPASGGSTQAQATP